MAHPTISVINFGSNLDDADAQTAIRAINRQIIEDFAPLWGSRWELVLHASGAIVTDEGALEEESVRGDGVLYLVDEGTVSTALGYHAINTSEMPFGFVFLNAGADWTATLSHEALEMMIDPTVNVLVPGPDPRDHQNFVLHTYEVCDAVERTGYHIDGVRVSNFITPNWFAEGESSTARNDFLGVGVNSFEATPGSHLDFFDLATNSWERYWGSADAFGRPSRAAQRFKQYSFDRKRCDDDEINARLEDYKKSPPKARALAGMEAGGLLRVDGLSRSSRKRASATRLFAKS